jgi:hypothetical protein
MPTTSQQASILAKAGVQVPPFPARSLPVQERYLREGVRVPQEELDADREQRLAAADWRATVNDLYEALMAARARRVQARAESTDCCA